MALVAICSAQSITYGDQRHFHVEKDRGCRFRFSLTFRLNPIAFSAELIDNVPVHIRGVVEGG